jgi:intein/homing endonuclease
MFNYLDYKNKIPVNKFIIDIPKINPLSSQYEKFWIHLMKKHQIEGKWVEYNNEWKWMPGVIFQYVNLWSIERKKATGSSKGKVVGKPSLRDIEWIKGYVYTVARGFSGFLDDDVYSCHKALLLENPLDVLAYKGIEERNSVYNSKKELKIYKDPLEYLYEYKGTCLGKPLYHNDAKNVVDIECRNIGKSFISANFAAHNFLTDGIVDFDDWLSNKDSITFTTQTLIAAIDSKYSGGVISKIKLGLDFLPGKMQIGDRIYPAPLSKKFKGSWECGKEVIAKYDAKVGGQWVTKGSGSGFIHRSFNDNPFAANGTRYGFGVIDEIGFMSNLEPTLGQLHECTTVDGYKYGTIWMTGTGGDMDGGSCVCAGTKLTLADGSLINVEDVKLNDKIVGYDIVTQQYSIENVNWLQPPSKKECLKITTTSGRELLCSTDHPILYSKWNNFRKSQRIVDSEGVKKRIYKKKVEFTEALNLKVGYQITLPNELDLWSNLTNKDARLLGFLIGDGTYSNSSISTSNCDKEVNDWLESNYDTTLKVTYKTKKNEDYKEFRIRGKNDIINSQGLKGQSGLRKNSPKDLFNWDKETACEYIGGYYDADGCILKDCILITSICKNLIEDLMMVLNKLGVHGYLRKKPGGTRTIKERPINYKESYNLVIKDKLSVNNFHKNIKLISKQKQDKLDNLVKSLESIKSFTSANMQGYRFEQIVSIENIGSQFIYNLEASNTHTYLANGIITHNTLAVMSVFYSPSSYDCLEFDDVFEGSGKKIGFFVPAWMALDEFRDEFGNVDKDKATLKLEIEREKASKSKTKDTLNNLLQMKPLKPSEAFLVTTGNFFPISDLKAQRGFVESSVDGDVKGTVGELIINEAGVVEFKPCLDNSIRAITKYPIKESDDPTGAVIIWEQPVNNPPYGLYIAGCLLPGEKVLTDEGLMNVEDVTLNNKLINKDGNLVDIINLQRYLKEEEDTYTIKVSNSFRATTFTQEHPIYTTKPGYNSDHTININKFDFKYNLVKDISVGDWIEYPNIYTKEIIPDFNKFWINDEFRIDRHIDNPLNNLEFWWLIGYWLGDGWVESDEYKISFVVNNKETYYRTRIENIIIGILNRKIETRQRIGCVELKLSLRQLNYFLTDNFGKYANGKFIPEWVKYLPKEYKLKLIEGYLASDGCVTKHTKGYYSTEFVSINLELLESIQDMLFSLGIISNLSKMRDEGKRFIEKHRESITQICYHLRLGNYDTLTLKALINNPEELKLNRIIDPKLVRRKTMGCFLSKDLSKIYFRITDIQSKKFSGTVYNFECETHTFMCHHINTHNCDPYSQDEVNNSVSLGSVVIMKKSSIGYDNHDKIVAEYTGRPKSAKEFYENCRRLLMYYKATCLYENNFNGLKAYFEQKNSLYLLANTPTVLKANISSSVSRVYGQHMTKQVKDELELYLRDWLLEEVGDGKLNLHHIYSTPILDELIYYNETGNFDRVIALMLTICLKAQMHHVKVSEKRKEAKDSFFTRKLFR